MNDLYGEYFEALCHPIERPTMYGHPEMAAGTAEGLAAIWVQQRKNVPLEDAFCIIRTLVAEACKELGVSGTENMNLSVEALHPVRKVSYDALQQHGKIFVELLKSLD